MHAAWLLLLGRRGAPLVELLGIRDTRRSRACWASPPAGRTRRSLAVGIDRSLAGLAGTLAPAALEAVALRRALMHVKLRVEERERLVHFLSICRVKPAKGEREKMLGSMVLEMECEAVIALSREVVTGRSVVVGVMGKRLYSSFTV